MPLPLYSHKKDPSTQQTRERLNHTASLHTMQKTEIPYSC